MLYNWKYAVENMSRISPLNVLHILNKWPLVHTCNFMKFLHYTYCFMINMKVCVSNNIYYYTKNYENFGFSPEDSSASCPCYCSHSQPYHHSAITRMWFGENGCCAGFRETLQRSRVCQRSLRQARMLVGHCLAKKQANRSGTEQFRVFTGRDWPQNVRYGKNPNGSK